MRIAFLCNGLEPGRDGVGDYTRRLAAECIRQGHDCRLVGLSDSEKTTIEDQLCDGIQIECLRCGVDLSWPERFQRARDYLALFEPDWISLQFVPYGFNTKGIAWRVARDLQPVIAGRPLHVMFHELWIGFGEHAPWKERIVGALQWVAIFRMLRALKPRVVNTSNSTYLELLKTGGVSAVELPLFGTIPVTEIAPERSLPPEVLAAGVTGERSQWWVAITFGTLHPEWQPEPLTGILLRAAKRAGKRICWIAAGRLGAVGEGIWRKMKRDYGDEIVFVKSGEQSAEQISALFQIADFGVASSPWNLMGKSSSAASMLDHGLPIIVTREGGKTVVSATAATLGDSLFHRCDETLEAKLVEGLPRREPARRVHEICARFINALR